MAAIKIIGQIITWILIIAIGTVLMIEQVPGNKNICDAGQGDYGLVWLIFYVALFSLLINSWYFLQKNEWEKYRSISITICSLIFLISISLRSLIFWISFGQEKYTYENSAETFELIDLILYENGKFYSWTYDASCAIENIGNYKQVNEQLELIFEGEKSKYMGTKYLLENDTLKCLNCNEEYRLILN